MSPRTRKPITRRWRGTQSAATTVRVLNAPKTPLRDVYHLVLRVPWWVALVAIVVVYFALNGVFAIAYLVAGGVMGARPGSFADAFYFSIQTMGTIGYGAMYPHSPAAHALVAAESVTGLLVTAVATGLVFAKFSQSTARVVFTTQATISPMDGAPTLSLRVGNQRGNQIIEAQLRMTIVRTEVTKEGMTFYRMHDLRLSRERSPAFARSWTAMHPIDESSPLFGETPEGLKKREVELIVTLVGVDDTSLQAVHARHTYTDDAIVWGARHADILTTSDDGNMTLDLARFHDLQSTPATESFPYSMS